MTDRLVDTLYDDGVIILEMVTDFDVVELAYVTELRTLDSKTHNFENANHKVLMKTKGTLKPHAITRHKELLEMLRMVIPDGGVYTMRNIQGTQ